MSIAKLELSTDVKPRLKLVGEDGNAFAIMGRAQRAWRKAKLPEDDLKKIMAEARNGDYDHLLGTIIEYFDVD